MELSVDSKMLICPKSFNYYFYCAVNQNIFSQETLIERIWGFDYEGDERTIDVHIDYVIV